jgi:ABC-type nickel/cobalt efflux system permease component RcnA
MTSNHSYRESLEEQLRNSITETRMVLPGVQAILGFQLIAVFNERFAHDLSSGERLVHMIAFILVAVTTGLMMAPAAYHRIVEHRHASSRFVDMASTTLEIAMAPLAIGLSLDSFLVFRLASQSPVVAGVLAAALLAFLIGLWFLFPYSRRLRDRAHRHAHRHDGRDDERHSERNDERHDRRDNGRNRRRPVT